jgi:hypothetical protein
MKLQPTDPWMGKPVADDTAQRAIRASGIVNAERAEAL